MKKLILIITIFSSLLISCDKDEEVAPTSTQNQNEVKLNNTQKELIGTWRVYEFKLTIRNQDNVLVADSAYEKGFNVEFTKNGEVKNSLNTPLTYGDWSFSSDKKFFKISEDYEDQTDIYLIDVSETKDFNETEPWSIIANLKTLYVVSGCQVFNKDPNTYDLETYCFTYKMEKI